MLLALVVSCILLVTFPPSLSTIMFYSLMHVSFYTHVGTQFSISNDLRHEVSSRAAIIRAGSGAVRKIIADLVFPIKNRHIYIY